MAKKKNEQEDLLWYSYNMAEEREFKTAVKAVQKICRSSLEYDLWQTRSKADSSSCPVCGEFYNYVKAETHHYPKTMFDICEDVVERHVFENTIDDQSGFGICQEVMNLHFLGNVNFVVLCKACHEKFHADHPEVVKKVSEVFEANKDKKPLPLPIKSLGVHKPEEPKDKEDEDQEEDKPVSILPPPPPPPPISKGIHPPKPEIIQVGNRVEILKDGIEIDI